MLECTWTLLIFTEDIIWKYREQYPACRLFDFHENFNLENISPLQIYFSVNVKDNLAITIYVEQRNRHLQRPLKSLQLSYTGPSISSLDLNSPKSMSLMLRISQTINLPESSECQNYPTYKYRSFGDCDREEIYKKIKNELQLMPFWAAKTPNEVTELRLRGSA